MSVSDQLDDFVSAYTPSFRYASDNELLLKAYAALIEERVREWEGASSSTTTNVLSLGIGHSIVSGCLIDLLAKKLIDTYTIIEGSGKLIDGFRARQEYKGDNLKLVETFFEDYVPAEPLAAIEMGFVLEHVEDPSLILSRFKDYLQLGGALFVAVPNARSLHRLLGHSAGLLPDLYQLSEYDLQLGHRRYFDVQSLKDMVTEAGYTIRGISGLVLKPLTTQQLVDCDLAPEVWSAFTKVGYGLPEISNGIYLEATV
ncbi:MAG: methyltransferase domain-containing protein [Hyphomicrobium sp.]